MVRLPKQLPDDPEQLKKLVNLLASERNDFFERLQILEQRYKDEMRAKYGRRSESLDPDQLRLFIQEALEQDESNEAKEKTAAVTDTSAEPKQSAEVETKKRGHGRRKPQELPRRPVLHDLPESEKACPRCTFQREVCGRTISLQLDYAPGHAFYWENIRLKYACRACDGQIQIAEAPEYPIDRGMPAAGMLSYIGTSKYADHLPLHRLEGILSRQGLILSRSTMCDWMKATAKILLPLFEYLIVRIKRSRVIWTDNTPVRVMDKALKKRCRTGRIWVYRGDAANPYVLFRFTSSRRRDGPLEHLENFKGFLQADAFAGTSQILGGARYWTCSQQISATYHPKVQVYIDLPFVEISNNASERSIKPLVLSRRNWLFAGSEEGGHTAATIMSLIETCKRLGINPFEYMKDLLTRFPSAKTSEIDGFLPDRWLAAKPAEAAN